MQWNRASFKDYLDVVIRIVDFICAHPELGREYRDELWIAFEKAITFHSLNNRKSMSHKERLSALQHQADRLPDKGLLTDDFAAMKLYIDYGISLFYLRKTMIGKQAKSMLKTLRTSRKS